jgi:hypothetical protein
LPDQPVAGLVGRASSLPCLQALGPELNGHGPKIGPKLPETSVKYVNIRPEMIENGILSII